ncbi:MAG TPA: hypothetical protein VMV79_08810 [Alphaproteobacteria bacterium]|nr:hypothetical protein [Alphaproteobacteria bacterium]
MRKPLAAAAFLILVLGFAAPPSPAMAQCCGNVATESTQSASWLTQLGDEIKSIGWLTQIFTVINSVWNFIQPAFSTLGGIITANAQVQTTGTYNAAQGIMDNARYNSQINYAGMMAAQASVSPENLACSTNAYGMARDLAGNDLAAMGQQSEVQQVLGNKGVGAGAGPVEVSQQFKDLCMLGFFTPGEYGNIPKQLGCTPDPKYADADELLSSLIGGNHFQYPVPSAVAVGPDQDLYFAAAPPNAKVQGSGSLNDNLSDSTDGMPVAKDFIAAWEYCQHLPTSTQATPPYTTDSGQPTVSQINTIMADRNVTAQSEGPRAECLHALWYRTACPSDAAANFTAVGMPQTCHDDQVAVCNTLRNCPNAGNNNPTIPGGPTMPACSSANANPGSLGGSVMPGFGITDNPYLKNCDKDGLSMAMADKIRADSCSSKSFMQTVVPGSMGSDTQLSHYSDNDCQAQRNQFQGQLNQEKEQLLTAIQTLSQMRDQNLGGASALSRPVSGQ